MSSQVHEGVCPASILMWGLESHDSALSACSRPAKQGPPVPAFPVLGLYAYASMPTCF